MKYSQIMTTLKEHAAFSYSGRFNILASSSKQYEGALFMKEGLIVKATFGDKRGWSALKGFLLDSLIGEKEYSLVAEPENIDYDFDSFTINISNLEKSLRELFYLYKEYKDKLPKLSLRLLASANCLKSEHKLSYVEFQILAVLIDYGQISELVKNCALVEIEILINLCRLREKGLVKVIG
jgi:hypothetical protein